MPRFTEDDRERLVQQANQMLDELFQASIPIRQVLNQGALPEGWAERYLDFVERVRSAWPTSSSLPPEIVAVVYNASVYCTKRYFDWQRLVKPGGPVRETPDELKRIREAGDQLLLLLFSDRAD